MGVFNPYIIISMLKLKPQVIPEFDAEFHEIIHAILILRVLLTIKYIINNYYLSVLSRVLVLSIDNNNAQV